MTEKEISEHYEKHLKVLESAIESAKDKDCYGDAVELSKQIMDTIYRPGISYSLYHL
ncbi:MAG: hypothetical protein ACI4JI_00105 [Ruminiclostridium sp.]